MNSPILNQKPFTAHDRDLRQAPPWYCDLMTTPNHPTQGGGEGYAFGEA